MVKYTNENVFYLSFKKKRVWKFKGITLWNRIPLSPKCKFITEGGMYENTGHLIHDSIRKGGMDGDHVISKTPIYIKKSNSKIKKITGKSIYLGCFFNHYGHFITEGLSRFRISENYSQYDNILISPFVFDRGAINIKSFHEFFFECFKIPRDKIMILDNDVIIESVVIPKQLWTINGDVDPLIKENYNLIRNCVEKNEELSGGDFFISRRENKNYQRISNIPEIESLMREKGVEIIYAEDFTIEEQLIIYKSANTIFTVSGSGAHNILFMCEGSKMVEIADSRTPITPIRMQQLANIVAVADYEFIPFEGDTNQKWNINSLENSVNAILNCI